MSEKKPKEFSELPDLVQDYLLDPEVLTRADVLIEKFSLGAESTNPLMDEVEVMVCNKHEVSGLPLVLASLFHLDEVKAKSLAVEVVGQFLLPLADYRQGDGEIIVEWGGNPVVFSSIKKLEIPVQTPEEFVEESLKEWQAQDPNHVLNSRLIFILSAFLKNERTEEETRSALARPIKVGGLALGGEAIEKVFELLKERKEREGFVYNPVVHEKVVEEKNEKVENEVKETEKAEEKKNAPVIMSDIRPPSPAPVVLEKKVEEKKVEPIVPKVSPAPVKNGEEVTSPVVPQKPVQPRPMISDIKPVSPSVSVSDSRVVDSTPTVQPLSLGERETSGSDSVAPVKSLEPLHQPEDKIELAKAAADIKEKAALAKAKTPLDAAVDSLISTCGLKFANDDLKKRFVHAVDSRLRDVRDAFETRDLLERTVEQGGLGWSGAGLVKVMEELEKVVNSQKAQWSSEVERDKQALKRAKEVEAKKRAADEAAQKKAAKPRVRPEPVSPVMSSGSVQQAGRSVVADIAFTRKLSGPVEELQNMSLAEFRRLSSRPEEAATKIVDKINLLEEQGIDQRVAGVKAWRQSPVNRLYLEMSKQALMSGKKMAEVITERAKAGLEVLSLEEIKVINEMNGGLRF